MDYDWQTKALERKIKRIMRVCNESEHFPLKVVGIAVAHPEHVEGAMYLFPDQFEGVEWADVVKDVLGDTTVEYEVAARSICEKWTPWSR